MPGFDRSGPQGLGPMTGRGFGPCFGGRRKFGVGRGLGRYFGWSEPTSPEESLKALGGYKQALKEELEDVEKEEKELEGKK